MQFRKHITKQSFKQTSQPSPNTFLQYQQNKHHREGSLISKKQEIHENNRKFCSNQMEKPTSSCNRDDQKNTERLLQMNLQKKEENWLTEEERKIVGDIGKLFSSQTSKPTKLLIRLNQTQSNKTNKSGQKGPFAQSRLQKIQVTRLDNHNLESNLLKRTHDGFLYDKQNENDRQSQTQPNLQSSLRSAKSSIRICHSPSQSRIQPILPKLSLSKQISIMFVPNSSQISNRNSPFYFSKFNRKNNQSKLQSINSNYSNDFHDDKDSKKDNPQGSNYVKLLEIQLFLRKQETTHQRSQELRHANEKLLSTHLFSKQELQKAKKYIEDIEISYKNKLQQLKIQLQQQQQQKRQLTNDLQAKQMSIQSLNKLNQQFLKENNELKQTIKENTKCIRQLKYQIANRQRNLPTEGNNKHPVDTNNSKKISFLKNENEYGQTYLPRSPRKQQITNHIPTFSNDLPTSYAPTQLNEKESYKFYRNDKVDINQAKLANCRSQGVLYPSQSIKRENLIKDNVHHNYQPTSRSHKHVGIRKNNFNQEPISPSTRNLVRINKNSINDGSILIGDKIKDNKSLSNFSQLSGKSLSQRVGYISKPAIQDKKSGILVDYMIESESRPKQQQKVQKKLQRFKFK